jgi:folate-binding protein YgfZ
LIEVTGADRASFLHSFTTNDVKKLPAGRGCEAFVTSPQGKTLGHVLILNRGPSLLLCGAPGQATTLISHFTRYIISEDLTLRDLCNAWTALLVAGPQAAAVLRAATGSNPPADSLALADISISQSSAILFRTEYAGAASSMLLLEAGAATSAIAACESEGAIRCGDGAVEMARVEAGVPLFGRDITDDNLPQEIGRDKQAISFQKGCYLGQETVARIDALGHVNRQLVGLKFDSATVPPAGLTLAADGKEVGHVTSAVWSPKLAAPLAIGLVRRQQAKAGTRLASSHGEAVIVQLPV